MGGFSTGTDSWAGASREGPARMRCDRGPPHPGSNSSRCCLIPTSFCPAWEALTSPGATQSYSLQKQLVESPPAPAQAPSCCVASVSPCPTRPLQTTSKCSTCLALMPARGLCVGAEQAVTLSPHFSQRDSWEQTMPDSLNPPDVTCSDSLQTLSTATSCLPHESSGASQYRGSSWSSSLPGAQSYSLHALEDVHYASGYPGTSPYSFPSFMTVPNDLTPKMIHLSSDEVSDTTSLHDNSSWGKEDGSPVWGTYECRRTY